MLGGTPLRRFFVAMKLKSPKKEPDLWKRVEVVTELAESWKGHSRQSEVTFYDLLYALPDHVLHFVRKKIYVVWKRRLDVAVMIGPAQHEARYAIILDTKLENESQKTREAILALKVAEAYLLEHRSVKKTREKLAVEWGYDLTILEKENLMDFEY